jgi:cytochrome c5
MIGAGAQVSAQELPVLVDYLFASYGKAGATPAAQAGGADPGKAILDAACTSCHGLEGLPNHAYADKEPYRSLVSNMVGYGASVSDSQMEPLVDYLFKTYGKAPAAAPAAVAAAGPDPGKAILDAACTSCHGLEGLSSHV